MIRLAKIAKGLVLGLALLFSGYLFWNKLLSAGYMTMTTSEHVQFYTLSVFDWLQVLLVGLVLLSLLLLAYFLPAKWLFALGTLIYLSVGLYLILGVDPIPRSDPRYVWEAALAFNRGDFSNFSESGLSDYLSIFPNQLGLVSAFRLLTSLSADIRWIWLVQLFLVLVNNLLLSLVADRLFHHPLVTKLAIVLSFAFLPSLFSILWAYGDLMGLTGVLVGTYCLLLIDEKKSWLLLFPAGFSLSFAIGVRSNYAIFALALLAVLLLKWLIRPSWLPILCSLVVGFSLVSPNFFIRTYYETVEKQIIPLGTPLKAWVVMGLNDRAANPGYWDGYTTLLPIWYEFDHKQMAERIDADFDARLQLLLTDSAYRETFFHSKFQATWNEPTYQSIYIGPLKPRGQEARPPLLKSLYEEGIIYQIYHDYAKSLSFWIYLGFLISLIYQLFCLLRGQASSDWALLFVICFIGGFLFHTVWEIKSRYVYPFVYVFIPQVAQLGQLSDFSRYLGLNWLARCNKKRRRYVR